MTDLQRAVAWLEHWKMVKECDARSYPHRTEHAEAANHCRVLLDALREKNEPPKHKGWVVIQITCGAFTDNTEGKG